MKQAVLIGPRRSRIEEVAMPAVANDGVLVRVVMSGVCASELHVWEKGTNEPLRLGHEVAGEVVEVGREVRDFRAGDRVTGLFNQGFADFAAAPAERVIRIPDALGYDVAFGEPMACAMSGARRTDVDLGDRIAVVGLGFMGLTFMQLLRLKGPVEIVGIDLRADARRMGAALGCDMTFHPDEVRAAGLSDFDLVVEATGTPEGLTQAGDLTRQHGRLSILGYHQGGPRSVDMQMWNFKALEVLNAHERRVDYRMDCMRRGLALAAAGRIDLSPMPTHRFGLDEIDAAFGALETKPAGFVKSLVVAGARTH